MNPVALADAKPPAVLLAVAALLVLVVLAALILAGAWLLSWPLTLLWRKGRKT